MKMHDISCGDHVHVKLNPRIFLRNYKYLSAPGWNSNTHHALYEIPSNTCAYPSNFEISSKVMIRARARDRKPRSFDT